MSSCRNQPGHDDFQSKAVVAPLPANANNDAPAKDVWASVGTSTDSFLDRAAMISSTNSKPMMEKRSWNVKLWRRERHWALVLQPSGATFEARITDDFLHGSTLGLCYDHKVDSSKFFLIFELVLILGSPALFLSVKPDFDSAQNNVQDLGCVAPVSFWELVGRAEAIVRRYKGYSLIGCNCQHFATELADKLGAPGALVPDDVALAQQASDSAKLAAMAASATSCITMLSYVLPCAAFATTSASSIGLVACPLTALLTATSWGYERLYQSLRTDEDLWPIAAKTELTSHHHAKLLTCPFALGEQRSKQMDKHVFFDGIAAAVPITKRHPAM